MPAKKITKILERSLITLCFLWTNSGFASIATPAQNNTPTEITQDNLRYNDASTLTSSQLGLGGPLSVSVSRDSLDDYVYNAQFNQKVNERFGFSALLDYGSNVYRYGATLGFKLFNDDLFKLTAERLSEVLPFDFDSGDINQRMEQNAFGARFQHAFANKLIQDISIGGYYANTPNKSLDDVAFSNNGVSSINQRNIAGATSDGIDIASDIQLTKLTELTASLYYDIVNYDTTNGFITTDNNDDKQGLGAGLKINQLIASNVALTAEGTVRKTDDTYNAGISWLPPFLNKLGMEVSLQAQHLTSHNDTPSSDSFGLKLSFNPAVGDNTTKPAYGLPTTATIDDVGIFASSPAVHMDRVLAIAEQKTTATPPNPTSNPQAVATTPAITGVQTSGDLNTGLTAT